MDNKAGQSLRRPSTRTLTYNETIKIENQIRNKHDPMKLEDIQNWMKEKGIIDGTKIKQEDLDRVYAKMEGKATDFKSFMKEIGKETKADMTDVYAKVQAALTERKAETADHAIKSMKETEEKVEGYVKSNTEINVSKSRDWFSSSEIVTLSPTDTREKKMKKGDLQKFSEQLPSDEKLNPDQFRKRFKEWKRKQNHKTESDSD